MIKDSELISFWLIKSETGKIIEASNNLEGIIERARVSAHKLNMRIDIVHYLGSVYPKDWYEVKGETK